MPRHATPLTAAKVRISQPGRYADGGGLYLFVRNPKAAFWVFRYIPPGGRMRAWLRSRPPAAINLPGTMRKATPRSDNVLPPATSKRQTIAVILRQSPTKHLDDAPSVLAAITAGAYAKGRRSLTVVHRRELLKQASEKLRAPAFRTGSLPPVSG